MNLRKDPFEVPFGHSTVVEPAEINISNLPDFEIRYRHEESGKEESAYFKFDMLLKPQEQKLVALDQLEEVYLKWLTLKFKGFEPVDYDEWSKLAKKLVRFFFAHRLSVEKPMMARGSGIYLSRWGYSEEDFPELGVMIAENLMFRSAGAGRAFVYDGWIRKSGGIGGFATVFGRRQMLVVEHNGINLKRLFSRDTIATYAINRLNEKLPGIVDRKLVTDFQWLPEGQYFGGDQPTPKPF